MATVVKHSSEIRRALAWVVEARKQDPAKKLLLLLDEAGAKFNLSPRDQEELFALLKEQTQEAKP